MAYSIRKDSSEKTRSSVPLVVYGASIGIKSGDRQAIIRVLRKGLPISSFQRLQEGIGVPASLLATVTRIAPRTLTRRKKEGRLQTDESERLLRISLLFDKAKEVLGDIEKARQWFKSPKVALGGKSPLEYADTEPGAREVEDLLGRLEHGVFS